jgi:NitT/TauT family transport system substrate-binding protein
MRLPMKLLVLSVGLSLALAASGTAQTPKPLRVTIPVIGMNFLPLFVAADKGMFAKEGFDVEIISTSGDGPDVDALIAGSVQFTVSTPNRLLTSYEQGKPLLAIMNMANRNAIDCVINKDVAARVGITENTPLDQKLSAGRSPDWLKMKNPNAPAVTREAEEDWGKERWR